MPEDTSIVMRSQRLVVSSASKFGFGVKHQNGCRINVRSAGLAGLLFVLFAVTASADEQERNRVEFFESKIRPVLVKHCYQCHSTDSKSVKGGLLLDYQKGLLKGGESGAVVTEHINEILGLQRQVGL